MRNFETNFSCETSEEVVYTLQEIIRRIEGGYSCGYLDEGDWSMSGEDTYEDDEENAPRKVTNIVWDLGDDVLEYNIDECDIPTEVEIPNDVEDDDIADFLSNEYGFCVKSFSI